MSVVTIATGRYLGYAKRLLPELEAYLCPTGSVQWVILTDASSCEVASLVPRRQDFKILARKIQPIDWPEITLFRYQIMLEHFEIVEGKAVMWLDADMALKQEFSGHSVQIDKLSFALHPGYVSTPNRRRSFLSLARKLISKFVNFVSLPLRRNLWEPRKHSKAYLKLSERRNYFHGAVWFGPRLKIRDFLEQLSQRVADDYERGLVALWHDESHLNWFANSFPNQVHVLPLNFSAWRGSKYFFEKEAVFESLDKKILDLSPPDQGELA